MDKLVGDLVSGKHEKVNECRQSVSMCVRVSQ